VDVNEKTPNSHTTDFYVINVFQNSRLESMPVLDAVESPELPLQGLKNSSTRVRAESGTIGDRLKSTYRKTLWRLPLRGDESVGTNVHYSISENLQNDESCFNDFPAIVRLMCTVFFGCSTDGGNAYIAVPLLWISFNIALEIYTRVYWTETSDQQIVGLIYRQSTVDGPSLLSLLNNFVFGYFFCKSGRLLAYLHTGGALAINKQASLKTLAVSAHFCLLPMC
jgi:hypothetical protein